MPAKINSCIFCRHRFSGSKMDSNRYVKCFTVYYYIYIIFGLLSQSILFHLIRRKSPPSLSSLKYYLWNTCLIQIIEIILGFFTQNRNLPNKTSLAILPGGPCKYFSEYVCFACYHIFLAVSMLVAISIANTVAFRFLLLRYNGLSKQSIMKMIAASYIPSILLSIIPFLDTWDFSEVRRLTAIEHPTYDLTIYGNYPGFANITTVPFLSATLIVAIGAYGIPLLSAILTKWILSMILRNGSMSRKTKHHAIMLVYGLACQTLLPLISYVPIITLYLISQITGEEMLLTEHFLMLCSGFPALIDPFISFYFIVPFRNALIGFVRRKPVIEETTMVVSSVSFVKRSL
ncbi:unnamed protein product [Caenorhabditis angaria]|uniref:Uncharacterized protein n=1 Tax=Caenorhabditis angaria TaxID=860376 RepID=A0A9P1IBT9_9PELO|nr:unnamed protein product [Caenorhabditis angaria]